MVEPGKTSPPGLAEARSALERTFGFTAFRGVQERAVEAVLAGRDVLILMPTGGGKSLCYQVPALILPGLMLVVSPLISLMKDQVDALERRGVAATFLNSSLTADERRSRLDRARRGELRLLYIAPERFLSPEFREALPQLQVGRLAVDEAHCVSEWGRDFRPAYLGLGSERRRLRCPLIALTATATPMARAEIIFHLGMRSPVVLAGGFDRPNLSWRVERVRSGSDRVALLIHRLKRPREGAAIVYAPTRRRVDAIADRINRAGLPAAGYHAGADPDERRRLQERFMEDPAPVLVATNAFGMGVDKPNVRLVLHYAMPGSLEAYYQEAGRAGRDGRPAHCILLHAHADRTTHDFLISQTHPEVKSVRDLLRTLQAGRTAGRPVTIGLDRLAREAGLSDGRQALAAARALERSSHLRICNVVESRSGGAGAITLECGPGDPPARFWRSLRDDRSRELTRLLWVQRYATHNGCRRAYLLRYFGEAAAGGRCGNCDRCRGGDTGAATADAGRPRGLGTRFRALADRLWPLPTGRLRA